ncbi:MAG: hypothetical protein HFJ03_08505 [Lachnospira sp.]|nr:hypothetical protein [Lachnospira sp.]
MRFNMYQCPSCGGGLVFDIPTQQLSCEHCDSKFDPYEINKESDAESQQYYDVTVFTCPQCGGEIISSDNTAANFCSFCGASTILTSRLSKEKRPNYIIPFKKTKEDCKKEYLKTLRHAIFTPKELKSPAYIDEFRGIYMPYWAYHITHRGTVCLDCSRSHRQGDYICTDHYKLYGDLNSSHKGISYDASSSFDDTISERIAPYDVKNMNRFTPSFLSGFYADTNDVDAGIYQPDAIKIANQSAYKYIKSNTSLNSGVRFDTNNNLTDKLHARCEHVDTAMFPVWFLSYRNRDRVAYATVNGQTGKVSADLPVSIGKYMIGSIILAIPIFILLNMLFTLRPTITLTITSILALLSIILYHIELGQIIRKDSHENDRGLIAAQQKKANNDNNNNNNRNRKKSTSKTSVAMIFSLLIAFIVFNVVRIILPVGHPLNFNLTGKLIFFGIITILGLIVWSLSIKKQKKVTPNSVLPGSFGALLALFIATIIQIINPVSDLYFYGACILSLITIMFSLINLIRYYNILATRRLPQFDNYRGGNDSA